MSKAIGNLINSSATRRAVLRGAGAAILTSTLSLSRVAKLQAACSCKKILIFGAGMAGLTAALELKRRGHQVTVIEYQDRIGGRLWSVPLRQGQTTEAGGGHFRANMPLVLNYIRQFDLPLLALNDGLPRYLLNGKTGDGSDPEGWPWDLAEDERDVRLSSTLNRYLVRLGLDTISVLDPNWPSPDQLQRFDSVTLGELLQSAGASPAFCELLDAHGGAFTTKSHAIAILPDLAYHFGDKNLFRIKGGNSKLPEAMATAIGLENFVLGEPVVEIDQTQSHIRVATRSGREFTGDAAISTIPFSVIDEIKTTPDWSEAKKRMFAEMEWDKSVKVVMQTSTPSWLAQGIHGWPMAGGDREWERLIDITGNEPGCAGNTFFYLNGANAERYLGKSKETRAQEIVDQFMQDMPGLIEGVIDLKEVAWTEYPWVKGSFGSTPVGGGWMIREWAQPEDRIHFAGDFTSLKTGWVEGAIESGLRAARQIDPNIPTISKGGRNLFDIDTLQRI